VTPTLADPTYSWNNTGLVLEGRSLEPHLVKWKAYIVNMTSQTWLTPQDTNRPVWWHMVRACGARP
jgi:hypothetical protein